MIDINRFLDDKQRVKSWPAKKEIKVEVLRHVATKFESGRFYTEKEVNRIIDEWHTFNDYFLIRRELVNNWFLSRTNSGSRYWREETEENKTVMDLIMQNFNIGNIESVLCLPEESNSRNYYILTDKGEFILKEIKEDKADISGLDMYPIIKVQGKTYYLQKFV